MLVDLARDAPPLGPATITAVGPAYPPAELAARKVLALFDRAALRDFVDVANVSDHYGQDALLRLAAEIDGGFDTAVFAQMAATSIVSPTTRSTRWPNHRHSARSSPPGLKPCEGAPRTPSDGRLPGPGRRPTIG